jgi:hypothetical protein
MLRRVIYCFRVQCVNATRIDPKSNASRLNHIKPVTRMGRRLAISVAGIWDEGQKVQEEQEPTI